MPLGGDSCRREIFQARRPTSVCAMRVLLRDIIKLTIDLKFCYC